jgi:hypothetical protein
MLGIRSEDSECNPNFLPHTLKTSHDHSVSYTNNARDAKYFHKDGQIKARTADKFTKQQNHKHYFVLVNFINAQ